MIMVLPLHFHNKSFRKQLSSPVINLGFLKNFRFWIAIGSPIPPSTNGKGLSLTPAARSKLLSYREPRTPLESGAGSKQWTVNSKQWTVNREPPTTNQQP
jgi:hypothetical protein